MFTVLGAMLTTYLLLRFLMYIYQKLRRKPNGGVEIACIGVLILTISTVIGGYGMQEFSSEPQFLLAFYTYFGPVMAVTVIELVRLHRKIERRTLSDSQQ